MVLHPHAGRVVDVERHVVGLELREVPFGHVHGAVKAEHVAVELDGALEVLRDQRDEVDAADHAAYRAADRARALAASTSRSLGGAVVTSDSSSLAETVATSSTARSKASALAREGLVV